MKYLLLLGPVIFIAITTILGSMTQNYNHKDNYISELSLGKYGLYQKINFVISGTLITGLCFMLSTYAQNQIIRLGWYLGMVEGVSLILSGIWSTDFGLPETTKTGRLHNFLYTVIAIPCMGAVYFVLGWGYRNIPIIWAVSWLIAVVSFVLYRYSKRIGLKNGTSQRIVVFAAIIWLEILAFLTLLR